MSAEPTLTTVHIPRDLHDRLREIAFAERISIRAVIERLLRKALPRVK